MKATSTASGLAVTVENSNGDNLSGADVLVIDSNGVRYPGVTDGSGLATLSGLPDGSYTVYAAADGYLPDTAQATQTDGSGSATVTLHPGDLATTNVESRRLTRDEIVAAGIDPNDPSNQNVFEFSIHLCFSDTGSCGDVGGFINQADQFISPTTDVPGGSCNSGSCTFSFGGGGGGGGGYAVGTPRVINGQPSIFWLVIPGKARFLKEFFDVKMVVTNLAASAFRFDHGSAALELPEGLSLAPTATPQSLSQSMGDIPGGTSGSADWIVRGDKAGDYDLRTTYTGKLQPFDRDVVFTSQTTRPLKVWGTNALSLIIDVDDQVHRAFPYHVRIGLKNVTDADPSNATDLYNPSVELLKQGRLNYIYSPRQQLEFGTDVIHPGDTFWTEDYILVPSGSGILDLSNSFVERTAGADEGGSDQIISHTPAQTPATAPHFDETTSGHFTWDPVPGATKYQLFARAGLDQRGRLPDRRLPRRPDRGDERHVGRRARCGRRGHLVRAQRRDRRQERDVPSDDQGDARCVSGHRQEAVAPSQCQSHQEEAQRAIEGRHDWARQRQRQRRRPACRWRATVRVVSTTLGAAFDTTGDLLPSSGWKYLGKAGQNKGYTYKDSKLLSGPISSAKLAPRQPT